MTDALLIINRHDLGWTTGAGRYVTTAPSRRALLTRTFGGGLNGWRRDDYALTQVAEMSDLEHCLRVCRWMAGTLRPGRILALHEKDLLLAAQLREELAIPGPTVQETLPYRDKHLMKVRAAEAGIPVPGFALPADTELTWGGPTVTKDRWGLGASSIQYWETPASAREGLEGSQAEADALLEERIEGEMFYCDSVVVGDETLFSHVSQYVVAPGAYQSYDWQADISPVDPDVESEILALNERTLDAMGRVDAVTHAEFFRDGEGRLFLCEIAARPGGGGVDLLVKRTTGVDLVACAVAIAEGRRPEIAPEPRDRVTVLLGLYPCATGTPVPGGPDRGVVHHQPGSSLLRDGPRHATDYTDMYLLEGSTSDEALRRLRQAVAASGRATP